MGEFSLSIFYLCRHERRANVVIYARRLYVVAILIMFYVVWSWITDTDYLKEEGVIIPKHVAEELIITEGVSEADNTKSAVEEKD